MTRKTRTHITPESAAAAALAPKYMTKHDFARRLYTLMHQKGWHQSELARQAGIPRDSVSVYIRGVSMPTPLKLQALAKALDLKPEELLPNNALNAMAEDQPSFEMRISPGSSKVAWLRFDCAVSVRTASKIVELLANEETVGVTSDSQAMPRTHDV